MHFCFLYQNKPQLLSHLFIQSVMSISLILPHQLKNKYICEYKWQHVHCVNLIRFFIHTMIFAQMHQFSFTFLLLRILISVPACMVASVMWSVISIEKSEVLLWRDVSVNLSDLFNYVWHNVWITIIYIGLIV